MVIRPPSNNTCVSIRSMEIAKLYGMVIFICIILEHNLKSCTIIKNLQTKEIYLYSSCINKVKYTESNELCGNIHSLPLDTRRSVRCWIYNLRAETGVFSAR